MQNTNIQPTSCSFNHHLSQVSSKRFHFSKGVLDIYNQEMAPQCQQCAEELRYSQVQCKQSLQLYFHYNNMRWCVSVQCLTSCSLAKGLDLFVLQSAFSRLLLGTGAERRRKHHLSFQTYCCNSFHLTSY